MLKDSSELVTCFKLTVCVMLKSARMWRELKQTQTTVIHENHINNREKEAEGRLHLNNLCFSF